MKFGFDIAKSYADKIIQLPHSFVGQIFLSVALSWLYAITAQMILPLYPVVITILPLPIYLFVDLFGSVGAYGFLLYLLQGALGAPFFAHGRSGFGVLYGPSGGYLLGMALAAFFLLYAKNYYQKNWLNACLVFILSEVIIFSFGLFQLSFFMQGKALLAAGLYYFLFGEILKVISATLFVAYKKKR